MKALATAAVLVFAATGAIAQSGTKGADMKGMDHKAMSKDAKADAKHAAAGTVKSVDAAGSSVTIAHDPIKTLNWPAMSMVFKVKDKAMLDKIAPGKKIEFEFVQQAKDYVITSVK